MWPPEDPYRQEEYSGPAHDFNKDTSPWTYGKGVNPNLHPSNTYRRTQKNFGRSDVPPYHPAYRPSTGKEDSDDEQRAYSTSRHSSSDEYGHPFEDGEGDSENPWDIPRVRRGSEGFEVREQSREEILRRYIESRGEEVGHYRRYVPESASASDEDDEVP
ncbi:hypothetical protein K439DRAFT_1082397 [Ramaria rubella]|nr:hypothetical protein K439DRAFT_1082397 [Ramaria rubella]